MVLDLQGEPRRSPTRVGGTVGKSPDDGSDNELSRRGNQLGLV